jgi:hypothetical protein
MKRRLFLLITVTMVGGAPESWASQNAYPDNSKLGLDESLGRQNEFQPQPSSVPEESAFLKWKTETTKKYWALVSQEFTKAYDLRPKTKDQDVWNSLLETWYSNYNVVDSYFLRWIQEWEVYCNHQSTMGTVDLEEAWEETYQKIQQLFQNTVQSMSNTLTEMVAMQKEVNDFQSEEAKEIERLEQQDPMTAQKLLNHLEWWQRWEDENFAMWMRKFRQHKHQVEPWETFMLNMKTNWHELVSKTVKKFEIQPSSIPDPFDFDMVARRKEVSDFQSKEAKEIESLEQQDPMAAQTLLNHLERWQRGEDENFAMCMWMWKFRQHKHQVEPWETFMLNMKTKWSELVDKTVKKFETPPSSAPDPFDMVARQKEVNDFQSKEAKEIESLKQQDPMAAQELSSYLEQWQSGEDQNFAMWMWKFRNYKHQVEPWETFMLNMKTKWSELVDKTVKKFETQPSSAPDPFDGAGEKDPEFQKLLHGIPPLGN